MSLMKAKLSALYDQEERFRREVELDTIKGRFLIECATELAGYYTGTQFIESNDNAQWEVESNREYSD